MRVLSTSLHVSKFSSPISAFMWPLAFVHPPRGLKWNVKCPCACRLRRLAQNGCAAVPPGIFPLNGLLWHVHVHFDCAGSHETGVAVLASCIFPYKMDLGISMCLLTAKRPPTGSLHRDLAKKPLMEILIRDLAKRPPTEISPTELLWRSCTEILPGDVF